MANLKEYQIKINGIQETINAVDSLNKQLETLESRIKALEGKAVNISSGGGSKSETSEKAKLEEQIAKSAEKIALARTEEYKALLMQKQILKEINNEQKASIAGDKLSDHSYNLNTMAGMKERLRDIKSAMQTTDIDSDLFKQLTKEAGELNAKLLEVEKSYGQFGRNVGNYANGVTEGIKNAKQELRELKTEMQNLANKKRKGIITQDEEERLKSVVKEYNNLKSTLEDANKPMDAMMDTVQSIVAIVSAGKGIASFFGLDGNKVEESLKKLLALQNAMQGLQTIQKQMSAGDGLGKYFASMNSAIDTGTKKLLVYNRAILGTGKAAKITAVSVKALGAALKTIGIGLVITAVVGLIDLLDKWLHKSKEVSATMQTINDIVGQTGQGYAKANINIKMAQKAIDNFNGSAKEEKKLLDQLNSSTNGLVANCKNLDEAKQKIVAHSDEYIEMMKLEAQAQALLSLYTSEYAKLIQKQQILGQQFSGNTFLNDSLDNVMQREFDQLDNFLEKATELQNRASDLRNSLFTDENEKENENINKNNNKALDAEEKVQELTLRLMREGLRKKLIELDNEKRKTLETVKGTAQEKIDIEKKYNELSLREVRNYVESVQKEYKQLDKSIRDEAINLELSDKGNLIQEMNNKLDVNRFTLGGAEEYLKFLIQNTDNFKGYWMNIHSQLVEIQQKFYKYSVEEQLKFFNQIEKLQKEDALLRKQQAEQAAIDEMNIWDEEQKQRVEDLEASIATIEGLGNKATEDQKKQLIESRKELQHINENYDTLANEKWINYLEKYRQIQQQYNNEYKEIELNGKKERSKIYTDFYETEIQKFNNFSTQLSREVQRQPELTQIGFINIAKTRENYEQARQQIKAVIDNIAKDIMDISLKYQSDENKNFGLISPEDYAATMNKLSDLENEFIDKQNDIDEKIKDLPKDVLSQINNIIQQVGQATNSILSSFSEITSNHYDKMIDEQQQYYDKLSDLLDKQRDKTQEYADAVNDIEGELSDARGDRRQQLIDQLNAEMAAQRASLEQEKRIEKEKEKAEHRKEQLEYDQAVARKKMDEAQALINGVMAASMAAVNHWPIPALPMIALATATAAAQYAAVRSQYIPKPSTYADGGVIQGNSHRDGGVPVLGGRAEVEGGEFITNKVTTANNTDLLQFINSKRKRVDISDLIDFYNSGKPSKNITGIRTKFADGGQLPLLRNDISMNDRILAAIEDYSNKPTVVQVVDIIDRTQKLNEVKVISGLEV